MRDFLAVSDLNGEEIRSILKRADELRILWRDNRMPKTLSGKRIALWFYGQGFRNRVAFEIGARALGADVTFIPGELGIHEPIEDIARYLDNWFSMLVIRCQRHEDLLRVARDATVPVINARTSYNHPCEILGDLQYIRSRRGNLDGLTVAFVGEVTNLCMGWFEAARVLQIRVMQVGPREFLADDALVNRLNDGATGKIETSTDLSNAVTKDVDVLYTDCWPRAGDKINTRELFLPFQVTKSIVGKMNPGGFFMPCPPITRGEEISEDSLTTDQYCDYEAKEFLLHAQNAIMEFCLAGDTHESDR